jgi:hypothetical protein
MPEATWEPHEKHGRLTTESDLPASVFAFPKQRKEPLTDAEHVRNAVARFDQVIDASDEDRDLAFANIQKAAADAESIPLQSRVAMDVSNAWLHLGVGGFISAGVRSVSKSVAATVLRASMHLGMPRQRGIRSLPASSRVRIGSTITSRGG